MRHPVVLCLALLMGLVSRASAAEVTLNISIQADDVEQKAIKRMYEDSCNARIRATPPQAPLGGCTSDGAVPTPSCVCSPSLAQYANALGVFLEQQLAGRYKNMLSEEARTIQDVYRTANEAERAAIRAACTSCPPFPE